MFRAALRTPALRTGLAPRLTQVNARTMSAAAHPQPHKSRLHTYWAMVPVDVYPLVFMVSGVCVLGVITAGYTLLHDKDLRLLPDRVKHHENN